MSVMQTCLDKIGWPNSRQGQAEMLSGAALFAGTLIMAVWGWHLSALAQVVLWVLLALASAVLLRRGWLKLFGPVLFYDMVRLGRRGRYILLRLAYLGVLLFFLFITYNMVGNQNWHGNLSDEQLYLRMAEMYFFQFMIIQFVAVALLTPAYVAGAIADEKERKTLEFMLATDLRNREIVLSKFVSRMANLTLFVLTGLPILSFLQFLGGVDPNLLLAGFLATFMTMIGMGGFSIFASVYFKRARDAVVISYLAPLVYILLGFLAIFLKFQVPNVVNYPIGWTGFSFNLAEVIDIFNAGNLPIALAHILRAIDVGQIQFALGPILRDYVIFHAVAGLVFTVWAVLRLRVIALRQANDTPEKTRFRHRSRPAVWNYSLLWKEIFVDDRGRASWLARLIVGILVLLTVGWGLWYIIEAKINGDFGLFTERYIHTWVTIAGTLVACLMILSVSVRAAGCISGERDKNTFDFLLTTPLDSDAILWGKFLGCLLSSAPPFHLAGHDLVLGIYGGALQIWEPWLLFVTIVIYASVFIALGLWFSMVCKSTMRATVFTIMSAVGISVGHWLFTLCCAAMSRGGGGFDSLVRFQAGMTPPVVIGYFHVAGFEFRHGWGGGHATEMIAYSFMGLFIYAAAGLFFWFSVLSPHFRHITNREGRIVREGERLT